MNIELTKEEYLSLATPIKVALGNTLWEWQRRDASNETVCNLLYNRLNALGKIAEAITET